ncbi:hypothetical protein GCM10010435_51070 [Winogradskya consettensis]|uniref:Uncharacterized protein n=1 Tax=Winogradskya consettensis TaxID=113560 RepID=A0A919SHH4_9ACTN|nr:hypothetical protein Aco04nite_28360 [Actinoplanes consettensis]
MAVLPCPEEGALTTRRGWLDISGSLADTENGGIVVMTAESRTLPASRSRLSAPG